MLCCAALIVALAVVRRVWRVLIMRGWSEPALPFPPAAVRPAPGRTIVQPSAVAPRTTLLPHIVEVLAATVVVYVAGIAVLLATGAATSGHASHAASHAGHAVAPDTQPGWMAWAIRSAILLAVVLACRNAARSHSDVGTRRDLGLTLLVGGLTFTALGIVDMHIFGLFEVAHGNILWDLIFHGGGAPVAVVGALVRESPSSLEIRSMS